MCKTITRSLLGSFFYVKKPKYRLKYKKCVGVDHMSRNWIERVKLNLLPLSKNSDITKAIEEWKYTGVYHDNKGSSGTCELCGHNPIVKQFAIQNQLNHNKMTVGSECILEFRIRVEENGEALDSTQARGKMMRDLREATEEKRVERIFENLMTLSNAEPEQDMQGFFNRLISEGNFTPKQLKKLFWRLSTNKISFQANDYKIALRTKDQISDLKALKPFQIKQIWDALSMTQKKKFEYLYKKHTQ
jgi:hypothetical protein